MFCVLVYGVPDNKIRVVPLGSSGAIPGCPAKRCQRKLPDYDWQQLRPVKRSVELAQLSRAAEVPILFVGKPIDDSDPYWRNSNP